MIAQISTTQAAEIARRIEEMRHQVRGLKKRINALEGADPQAAQSAPTGR
jgi:hypothetical protein